jgi:SOS response regulatory protein OraA/RecX
LTTFNYIQDIDTFLKDKDWKHIKDWSGYIITNTGDVISEGNKSNHNLPILLNQNPDKDGYLRVTLANNKYRKTKRVLGQLIDKGYVDDKGFTEYWVRNRFMKKGISGRKLRSELASKGVDKAIVEEVLQDSGRNDTEEIMKIIEKKRSRYDDQKLMQYLARQGFSYDDIKAALAATDD